MARGQSPFQGRYTVPIHDYSPITRGGAAWGEAFKGFGRDIGTAVKERKTLKGKLKGYQKQVESFEELIPHLLDDDEASEMIKGRIKEARQSLNASSDMSLREQVAAYEQYMPSVNSMLSLGMRKVLMDKQYPEKPPSVVGQLGLGNLNRRIPPTGVQPPAGPPTESMSKKEEEAGEELPMTEEDFNQMEMAAMGGPAAAAAMGIEEPEVPAYPQPIKVPATPSQPGAQPIFLTVDEASKQLQKMRDYKIQNPGTIFTEEDNKHMAFLANIINQPQSRDQAVAHVDKLRRHSPKASFNVNQNKDGAWLVSMNRPGDKATYQEATIEIAGFFEQMPGLWERQDGSIHGYHPDSGELVKLGDTPASALTERRQQYEASNNAIYNTNVLPGDNVMPFGDFYEAASRFQGGFKKGEVYEVEIPTSADSSRLREVVIDTNHPEFDDAMKLLEKYESNLEQQQDLPNVPSGGGGVPFNMSGGQPPPLPFSPRVPPRPVYDRQHVRDLINR